MPDPTAIDRYARSLAEAHIRAGLPLCAWLEAYRPACAPSRSRVHSFPGHITRAASRARSNVSSGLHLASTPNPNATSMPSPEARTRAVSRPVSVTDTSRSSTADSLVARAGFCTAGPFDRPGEWQGEMHQHWASGPLHAEPNRRRVQLRVLPGGKADRAKLHLLPVQDADHADVLAGPGAADRNHERG